jgi:hypothetical protein
MRYLPICFGGPRDDDVLQARLLPGLHQPRRGSQPTMSDRQECSDQAEPKGYGAARQAGTSSGFVEGGMAGYATEHQVDVG